MRKALLLTLIASALSGCAIFEAIVDVARIADRSDKFYVVTQPSERDRGRVTVSSLGLVTAR